MSEAANTDFPSSSIPDSSGVLSVEEIFLTLEALRHPETGCPWDRKQTLQTMLKPLREEVAELAKAVEADDPQAIAGEAGDVLWNILTILQIARERGLFSPQDVADSLVAKMVGRHPHVFAGESAHTESEARAAYQAAKAEETR